jgi:hypothetical protein
MPDVRGDVGERFGAWKLRDDVLAVVEHVERRGAVLAYARDRHRARRGVERALGQLGERLARVGLRPGEPADQLERVGRAEAVGSHLTAGGIARHS